MIERLVESWLDSQSERQYQPAFVQALVSDGWAVLHNSRHSPLEFGKDVIARDPQGELFFFQLKGNPGGRFTKNQAQTHLPQLVELIQVPASPTYYKSDDEKATAVFVTNGTIDEEAEVELDRLRANLRTSRTKEFLLWSRGNLLMLFLKNSAKVWPTSLEGVRAVLNMHGADGRSNIDIEKLATLDDELLSGDGSTAATEAMVGQYGVISQILKAPWEAAGNHYAMFQHGVVQAMRVLPLMATGKRSREVVQHLCESVLDHAEDLIAECVSVGFEPDKIWSEGDFMGEQPIMLERRALIAKAAATLLLSPRREKLEPAVAAKAAAIVLEAFPNTNLWGEAAIVGQIILYFAICATQKPPPEVRLPLAETLRILTDWNGRHSPNQPLPSFYYSFEQVWRFNNDIRYTGDDDDLFNDSFVGRASTSRALMLLLAAAGEKAICQQLWVPFSHLTHEGAALDNGPMFFSARHQRTGSLQTHDYHGMTWAALRAMAAELEQVAFLEPFAELDWLIAAYIAVVPYRGWTEVILWLNRRFAAGPSGG